jgi:hypothetical protein
MGENFGGDEFFEKPNHELDVKEYDSRSFRRDRTPVEKAADSEDLEVLRAAARYEGMAVAREKARARENNEIAPVHVHTPNPKHLEDLDYRPDRSN